MSPVEIQPHTNTLLWIGGDQLIDRLAIHLRLDIIQDPVSKLSELTSSTPLIPPQINPK